MQTEQNIIDLRSDSLTKAPHGMLVAMSQVGLRNDQQINSFEDLDAQAYELRLAKLFQKEAAIIYPTRIMANNAAAFLHAKQGSEVVVAANSHVIERQCSAIVRLVGVQTRQIFTKSGIFSVEQAKQRIRKEAQHFTFPDTDLLFIENPTSRGMVWPLQELRAIKKMAEELKVKVHIDGTRIFNALAHYKLEPKDISDCYDTMYVNFEKGLCCPVGGAILGSKQEVEQLFLLRKGLGGGFFNMGIVAAAEAYALDHLLPVVQQDNQIAYLLASKLAKIDGITCSPEKTHINTVHWQVTRQNFDHPRFQAYMLQKGIKIKPFDQDYNEYRFAVYNRIREVEVDRLITVISEYFASESA